MTNREAIEILEYLKVDVGLSGSFLFEGRAGEIISEALDLSIQALEKQEPKIDGKTSDGYHTFNELYYHRMILFSVICNIYKEKAWKSRLHDDGTMYDNYFIVGIETAGGQYTYHYHSDYWDFFDVKEIPKAPEYDGHQPKDIVRLLSLKEVQHGE